LSSLASLTWRRRLKTGIASSRASKVRCGKCANRSCLRRFTDGFDTLDLKEAKALLDEL
jgi:hypothetical protein